MASGAESVTEPPLIIDRADAAGLARVHTTALLPSGAVLSLTRRSQGAGSFLLSDEGAGAEDARALGHLTMTGADNRRGRDIAEQFGLEFNAGAFQVRDVTEPQLYAAAVYLAEATRRWSAETVEASARRGRVDLIDEVEERVRRALGGVRLDRERELVGESSKRHRFDLVADAGDDRLILFETVSPAAVSLSAVHLKLFDLKSNHPEWPRETVTERLDAWDQADMVLLAGVSTHVRDFSRAEWDDLRTLAL